MKFKISIGFIIVSLALLVCVIAVADISTSAIEVIEQVAVPIAKANDIGYYTHTELDKIIKALAEVGISLDEKSTIIEAFNSEHGFWKADTIREICIATFGSNERHWSIEQKHWYGEIMVSIDAWPQNIYLEPSADDMNEMDARKLAVEILKATYDVDLPMVTNDIWAVSIGFGINTYEDENSKCHSLEQWIMTFGPLDKPHIWNYYVCFDRHGDNIRTDYFEEKELDENNRQMYKNIQTGFSKINEAVAKYGKVEHFWPEEIKQEIYGGVLGEPYAFPKQADYDRALEDAKEFITEKFGLNALKELGDYHVGYLFQKLDIEDDNLTLLMWDFALTTDPEFLSDGYRVQFQRTILNETGEEEITDLIVDHANLWSLP